jgi:hypothetical protein
VTHMCVWLFVFNHYVFKEATRTQQREKTKRIEKKKKRAFRSSFLWRAEAHQRVCVCLCRHTHTHTSVKGVVLQLRVNKVKQET